MADRFGEWMKGYLKAWHSNDPADITPLFTEDARYLPTPFSPPWVGPEKIAREWIDRKDEPGGWEFDYDVIARDGDVTIVKGTTRYTKPEKIDYANLWAVTLDADGRCSEFTEWWMEIKN